LPPSMRRSSKTPCRSFAASKRPAPSGCGNAARPPFSARAPGGSAVARALLRRFAGRAGTLRP
jgi:hypothetical protein